MSLNNIQLQDFIVDELYRDTLLASPETAPTRRPIPPAAPTAATALPTAATVTPTAATASPGAATATTEPPAPAAATPTPATPPTATNPPAAKPATGASLADIAATMRKNASATTTAQPAAPPPDITKTPDTNTTQPYKTLGNHRRKVTILVNTPGTPFLPDNQLNFLTKILEACRMNIGDVAIVNHAAAAVNITALRDQLQPTVVILFGLEPTTIRLPINFPEFRLQPYDQCTYLSAPPLGQLVQNSDESRLLKSKLWVCLKTLFDV